jgi:hypothetical protein
MYNRELNQKSNEALLEICRSKSSIKSFFEKEANVESTFIRKLLEEVMNVPFTWFNHQQTLKNGKRPDVSIHLNNRFVLIIECKRRGELSEPPKRKIAKEQVFNYAELANCHDTIITDSNYFAYYENRICKLEFLSSIELYKSIDKLLPYVSPARLYRLSSDLDFLYNKHRVRQIYNQVKKGAFYNINKIVDKELLKLLSEEEVIRFLDELETWKSLWGHIIYSRDTRWEKNQIIHVDSSFLRRFDDSWYYNEAHRAVIKLEEDITRQCPGLALRIFVYSDFDVFRRNTSNFSDFIRSLLNSGYRIGFVRKVTWDKFGINKGDIDIVANKYAKLYADSNLFIGETITNPKSIKLLRDKVLEAISTLDTVFEPALHGNNDSIAKFRSWYLNHE